LGQSVRDGDNRMSE